MNLAVVNDAVTGLNGVEHAFTEEEKNFVVQFAFRSGDKEDTLALISHTMESYWKYFLSCVFEAVTMALAIVVCNAFINAGLPSFTTSYEDWTKTLIYLCEMTFTIAMTVGSVKGAQTLTSRAFGL